MRVRCCGLPMSLQPCWPWARWTLQRICRVSLWRLPLNANFLSNQSEGTFKATSTFVKKGRTVSVVRTTVTGAGEKLVADITTSHVLSK